jgi:hypothetical protein
VIQFVTGELPHSSSSDGNAANSQETLTLRALVGTKDAGIIIGKGGKNVADLREQTGVKAGVSKVVSGVHERVLSVSGPVQGVAKVSSLQLFIVVFRSRDILVMGDTLILSFPRTILVFTSTNS